jgi:hypothetical protein
MITFLQDGVIPHDGELARRRGGELAHLPTPGGSQFPLFAMNKNFQEGFSLRTES